MSEKLSQQPFRIQRRFTGDKVVQVHFLPARGEVPNRAAIHLGHVSRAGGGERYVRDSITLVTLGRMDASRAHGIPTIQAGTTSDMCKHIRLTLTGAGVGTSVRQKIIAEGINALLPRPPNR